MISEINQFIEDNANGSEFIAEVLKQECTKYGILWIFIQPGEATQNSFIVRFNSTFRHKVLDIDG